MPARGEPMAPKGARCRNRRQMNYVVARHPFLCELGDSSETVFSRGVPSSYQFTKAFDRPWTGQFWRQSKT